MKRHPEKDEDPDGWDWFETDASRAAPIDKDGLARSFARCFNGNDGAIVLLHLRQSILDRRLGPRASDSELRFLEGQRSVAAHILSMIDRGNG